MTELCENVYNGNSRGSSLEEAAARCGIQKCCADRLAADSELEKTIEIARREALDSAYSAVKGALCVAVDALKGIASDANESIATRACAAQILLRNDLLFALYEEIEEKLHEL